MRLEDQDLLVSFSSGRRIEQQNGTRFVRDPRQVFEVEVGSEVFLETSSGTVYFGRFDDSIGFEALLHDVDVYEPAEGADPEAYIRETATYGVDVKHRDLKVDATQVTRWRPLGDIEKLT